ncbi:MAG: glycogen/starch synthase, partial [Synergistaceae bacterium]|nr:glycogen/starch synthase [Synergistaceae bacterium]
MIMAPEDFSLRVLHVSPECTPFAKKGGLGDVVGALPKALREYGVDARVLMPAWPGVLEKAKDLGILRKTPIGSLSVAVNWRSWIAQVYIANIDGVTVYMLHQPELFSDPNIYPEDADAGSALPFIFLSYAALELPTATVWKPQFIHAHDWPAAIIPSALKWHRYYSKFNGDYDTVFTIHNMAHQGIFDHAALEGWGLQQRAYSELDPDTLEFYGQANLMKGAIVNCEAMTTVSPTYSWDIQAKDGGFGLDGVIVTNRNKLSGIINGIDYDVWDPAKDTMIPFNFTPTDTSGKERCRAALLEKCGWKDNGSPIAIYVGRLAEQKGVDIMLDALTPFLPDKLKFIIIGSGTEVYNRHVRDFTRNHPESVYPVVGFSEEMAHLAYAGGDMLLMPSLFEPCGLSQLIAFKYGTIPIARATGGLADTVIDADSSED